ncbi:MAG: GNAT family N-acetyltransferase [Burkholderiaceae bacterium]|nr:GNAT family N-acetyltransferase [Burkholderiaceae bacterium]
MSPGDTRPTAQVWLHGPRVTLRPWTDDDLAPFAALNADAEVMRHFPAMLDRGQSDALAGRVRERMAEQGWGLWALQTPELAFAGFVGLARVPFELPLPGFDGPQLEIGWRLARPAWGLGYAGEGAMLALDFAQRVLRQERVVSFTAWSNQRSAAVMRRIGLQPAGEFDHPRLAGHALQRHLLYTTPSAD